MSIILPNVDFDIRLKTIHDEFNAELEPYITNLLNNRSKPVYDTLKDAVFNYMDRAKKFETPVTHDLFLKNQQVNSLYINIYDYNQTAIINTFDNASNTYEDFIDYTLHSKNLVAINEFQYLSLIRSSVYGYHGGYKFNHVHQEDIEIYVKPHDLNNIKYFILMIYLAKDNVKVQNQISYPLPDIYPVIDYRLKAIHDEFNSILSSSINDFIEDKTEISYNIMANLISDYLDKIKKYETPVTEEFQRLRKQINSPRIIISDCNRSVIYDTFENAHNTLSDYFTHTIQKSDFTHKTQIEYVYALLYGHYGGTKYGYISQKDINFYVKSHGSNLSLPTYYININCLSDENNMLNDDEPKLELLEYKPSIDFKLKLIQNEFSGMVSVLIDKFIDNKTDDNYNILKDSVFEYLKKIINCETPITKQLKLNGKQVNSPRILIADCDLVYVLDTFDNCNNTLSNYLNVTVHFDNPTAILHPDHLMTAFYGYTGGTKFSLLTQKNWIFYIKSYGPVLSQAKYYIAIAGILEENIIEEIPGSTQ